jgi:hypothetical protein
MKQYLLLLFSSVIKGVALFGFNTSPLGALLMGGAGGFVPPHTQKFQGEIIDTAGLALRLFIMKKNMRPV